MATRKTEEAQLETSAEDLLNMDPEAVERPVEEVRVLFMPLKDLEARVNQEIFQFRKGIKTWVTRDLAATLTANEKNGYVMET